MKVKSVRYVGKADQKCITIKDPKGLFVTTDGIVTHNSPEKVLRTFKKTKARVASRMKGNYYGRVILDSSPNSMEDPMDQWINHDAPKSRDNFIVRGSLWELNRKAFPEIYINGIDKPPVFTPQNSFKIFKGGNGNLPCILAPGQEANYAIQDIIDVPNVTAEGVNLRDSAEEDILNFIRDQCAIATEGADRVFYDLAKVEDIFCDKLRNIYYGITASAADNPNHLIWDKIHKKFFKKVLNRYLFWYKPSVERTLSVDQSITGDVTGIAVSHVERDKYKLDPNGNMVPIYITDFQIAIIPQKNDRISLDAIKFFIEDLIKIGNMNIRYVSFDTFQSEATEQYLTRLGVDVCNLSVDFPNDPYVNFISLYFQGRLKAGRNIFYKNNILSIRESFRKTKSGEKGTMKYDHTDGDLYNGAPNNYNELDPMSYKNSWTTCKTGTNAKDILDATVASVELLRRNNVKPLEVWDPDSIEVLDHESAKEKVLNKLRKDNWVI